MPRMAGHRRGVDAIKRVVYGCAERGIEILTLFAFSSENWHRPRREIDNLMELFSTSLQNEIDHLHDHEIRLRFIGCRSRFSAGLRETIRASEERTQGNQELILQIAADYGGRWDIVETTRHIARSVARGDISPEQIDEALIGRHISTADYGDPDLFIRTGGDYRVSNFLLWQLAYTELYFCPVLWPDFDIEHLDAAIAEFRTRERRFGKTGEQIGQALSEEAT